MTRTPLIVGAERNAHGTRISRRIKCDKCGELDHIASRPQKGKAIWCRTCAKLAANVFDIGVVIPTPMVKKRCSVCRCLFELPVSVQIRDGKKPTCKNCMKGFDVWRGSLDMTPENREKMELETRQSGTLLRKRVAKTP